MTHSDRSDGRGADRDVVVGVDRSVSSQHAARWAANLPASLVSRVRLVHVVPPDVVSKRPPPWLAELAAVTACQSVDVSVEMSVGDVGTELVERSGSASILVVGSDGEGAEGGLRVGPVALELLDRARCPVAVVRGCEPGAPPPDQGTVVVGVDGSPAAASALALGADLADGLNASLVAVHTWADVRTEPEVGVSRLPESWDTLAAEANTVLDDALVPVRARFPALEIRRRVLGDNPLQALIDIAADARIIVVGNRGTPRGHGMLARSTSRALVEFASCPVLVTGSAELPGGLHREAGLPPARGPDAVLGRVPG
jgi:nucleotide-binding universal stress UspA family protein